MITGHLFLLSDTTMSELIITEKQSKGSQLAGSLIKRLSQAIDDIDEQAAAERVAALRRKRPLTSPSDLADNLIYNKCLQTAVIGAVSSSTSILPGVGTLASLTVGTAADISLTFKAQAELVLELAILHNHILSPDRKKQVVLLITGISAGTSSAARRAGQKIALKTSEKFAENGFIKAIPFVGIGASAAMNIAMTYAIGVRAKAYFSLGEAEMLDIKTSMRAITGIDGRRIKAGLIKAGAKIRQSPKERPLTITAVKQSIKQLTSKAGAKVKRVLPNKNQ